MFQNCKICQNAIFYLLFVIQRRGIQRVLLRGDGDAADILKLTLLEHGVVSTSVSADWAVSCVGSDYHLEPCAGEVERTLPAAR